MEKEANVVLCKPTNTTMFLMKNRKKVALIDYKIEKGKGKKREIKKKKKTENEIEKNGK